MTFFCEYLANPESKVNYACHQPPRDDDTDVLIYTYRYFTGGRVIHWVEQQIGVVEVVQPSDVWLLFPKMKVFALLHKLKVNRRYKQNETPFFSLHINKRFIYVGSTNGKIFIFKKEDACLFSPVVLANVITNVESGIITKICAVEGLDMLIHGTDQGDVFLLSNKGKSFRLASKYHKGVISSINYIMNEKRRLLYLFVGDLDGVLSYINNNNDNYNGDKLKWDNSFSFHYLQSYFLNNKFFINLLEGIIKMFSSFNFPLKPNLNMCYKMDNTYLVLFQQTHIFSFSWHPLKEKIHEANRDKQNVEKLTNDIEGIKNFVRNQLMEEQNEDNRKCLYFVLNNFNDAKQILHKIKSKKIFLINIKSIHIEEVLDLHVNLSRLVYTSIVCNNPGREQTEGGEIKDISLHCHTDHQHVSSEIWKNEKHQSEGKNSEIISFAEEVGNNPLGNPHTDGSNHPEDNFTCKVVKENTTGEHNKQEDTAYLFRPSIEYSYGGYFAQDRIIDSVQTHSKVCFLYYNVHLSDDLYVSFNVNGDEGCSSGCNGRTLSPFGYRRMCGGQGEEEDSPFYLCEVYFDQNYRWIKYLIFEMKKIKTFNSPSSLLILYLYITFFHSYLMERKQLYDTKFFSFLEKNIIKINELHYVNKVEEVLLKNVETIKGSLKSLLSFSFCKEGYISNLSVEKNCIYGRDFSNKLYKNTDFYVFNFNIKKLKRLYNTMRVVIMTYRNIFKPIFTTFLNSDISKWVLQTEESTMYKEDVCLVNFLLFVQSDNCFLLKMAYYFHLFVFLEVVIANHTHRNSSCFTSFPVCHYYCSEATIRGELIYCDEKTARDRQIIQREKKVREKTEKWKHCEFPREPKDFRHVHESHCFKSEDMFFVMRKRVESKWMIYHNLHVFLSSLHVLKMKKLYNLLTFYEKIKLLKWYEDKKKFSKSNFILLNDEGKKKVFSTLYNLGKIIKMKGHKKEKMISPYQFEIHHYDYFCNDINHLNILKISHLKKRINSVYNNTYYTKWMREKKYIHTFLNLTKRLYFYEKVIDGVYIVNLCKYRELYEYLLLYYTFYNICDTSLDITIMCKNNIVKNDMNYFENLLSIDYTYDEGRLFDIVHRYSIDIVTNREIEFFENLNRRAVNNNIILLDILLSIYSNLGNDKKKNFTFFFKKFSSFSYLSEYVNYVKEEEKIRCVTSRSSRKDSLCMLYSFEDNFSSKEKEQTCLSHCEDRTYHNSDCEKYYMRNTHEKQFNMDWTSGRHSRYSDDLLLVEKQNGGKKRNTRINKQVDLQVQNGNNFGKGKKKKFDKNERGAYLSRITLLLKKYTILRNSIVLKKGKNENYVFLFFKDLSFFNFVKIAYSLCKEKYNHRLGREKKLQRWIGKNYTNGRSFSVGKTSVRKFYKNSICRGGTCLMDVLSRRRKGVATFNLERVHYGVGTYTKKSSNMHKRKTKLCGRNTIINVLKHWNIKVFIEYISYIKKRKKTKNISKKIAKKKHSFVLYKLLYILSLLKWKKAIFILLHIFKKYNRELIFFLLLVMKYPVNEEQKMGMTSTYNNPFLNSRMPISEKMLKRLFANCVPLLKGKFNFESIAFYLLLRVKNNVCNYYIVMVLIMFYFFLEKQQPSSPLERCTFLKRILSRSKRKKFLSNTFVLYIFFFKNDIFFRKKLFSSYLFIPIHSSSNFLLSDYPIIKCILQSSYKLLNFEKPSYFLILNNTLYFHFTKLVSFFYIDNCTVSSYHFFFFMLISYFYIGYFAYFRKYLRAFHNAFNSTLYKLRLSHSDGRRKKNHRKETSTSYYIHNWEKHICLTKRPSDKSHDKCYVSSVSKPTVTMMPMYATNMTRSIIDGRDDEKFNTNLLGRIKEKICWEEGEEKMLSSTNFMINFFYELLLKWLCEINFKMFSKRVDLYIFSTSRNADVCLKICKFVNCFYGSCTIMHDDVGSHGKHEHDSVKGENSHLSIYDKENNLHVFLEIINFFFDIYYCLLSFQVSFKKRKPIYISKKSHYKKYLLSVIYFLFFHEAKWEDDNFDWDNPKWGNVDSVDISAREKRSWWTRMNESRLSVLCCVLCIAHFVNHFKYIKKGVKKKLILVIDYFMVNQPFCNFKQSGRKNLYPQNIHQIYKTIINSLPKKAK
ncbi:conserved Plasmodium protein, unknown function [Plasmodium ovale curtisi]|uniref:Uncharacterized protein n=1 Tax=Plasmodium ovale curtisi TaxID=864141 RepID=A0A1A8WQ64_PLAOA|nr:conserved Plasmodium protein, unknown function [Plasmodium ovale curtisi]